MESNLDVVSKILAFYALFALLLNWTSDQWVVDYSMLKWSDIKDVTYASEDTDTLSIAVNDDSDMQRKAAVAIAIISAVKDSNNTLTCYCFCAFTAFSVTEQPTKYE